MNQHVTAAVGSRVFISHAHEDDMFADRLARLLEGDGYSVFSNVSLEPAADWTSTILDGLRSADVVIFVVPAREGGGKNALAELGAAKAMGKRIVPVLPETSRSWNADVARIVSHSAVVDASRFSDETLVGALALQN
ncbi:toll/interleukin-1 receptor domain-containing protein [Aquibium sp. ELW1220]|uniref:toll/interleukin-1 receptor domain-containing protein n=1 Tax=Aquibium sp. ELW1220 TaxID=2976766 RepID=UPI0025B0C49A|nr:toll/interleukin-1 receptor domain-containing protein [Aquibium sp. ELW1220]MDN2580535.1 toll/interleukin-1 receptor domain-containing protein [Aquibium sp. ELW1220]